LAAEIAARTVGLDRSVSWKVKDMQAARLVAWDVVRSCGRARVSLAARRQPADWLSTRPIERAFTAAALTGPG